MDEPNIPVSDYPDWLPQPDLETVVTYNKAEDGLSKRIVEDESWN